MEIFNDIQNPVDLVFVIICGLMIIAYILSEKENEKND